MRRLQNISYWLLAVVLVGSAGCRHGLSEEECARRFGSAQDTRALAAVHLRPAPAPVAQYTPAPPVPVVEAVGEGSAQRKVTRIYPCPECGTVQLDKTMPGQTEMNKPFDYFIKLTNLTGQTLSGIVVTEELPENFELTSANPTAKQDGKTLVWEIDSLGPRAGMEITVAGIPSRTENLKYCTNVVTPMGPTCATVQVIQPRLKLAKLAPEGVLLCEPIEVKFVVTNTGTGAAQDVKIVDTLPDGLLTADGKSELVIGVGTVKAGEEKEFTAQLKATRAATFVNKAVASSSDGLEVESGPTTTVVDEPALSITQSGPDKQYVGRQVTYEITLTNQSDAPAKNAIIENEIPNGVTSMRATAGAKLAGDKIVWALGTIPPKGSKSVRVSFSPTGAGVLTNNVTASAQCADSVSASTQTTVRAISAVLLEVVDISDPVEVGNRTTYVITVTNQGSAPSTNVDIVCVLEDNVRYVSSSGATAGVMEDSVLTFAPLASLEPKARATWRVIVTALRPGDTRFRATMNANELTRPVEETEATRVYE